MLYYIKYYIFTEPKYPINHQITNDIIIDTWQQVLKLDLNYLIDSYKFKEDNYYMPYFVFFKYENQMEKDILINNFKDKIVDTNTLNICNFNKNIFIDNIIVVKV